MAVYLIQGVDGGLVKIGTARVPNRRLVDLQAGSPVLLRVLASTPGDHLLEARLHARYQKYRKWGEWFDLPEGDLRRLVESMKYGCLVGEPGTGPISSTCTQLRAEAARQALEEAILDRGVCELQIAEVCLMSVSALWRFRQGKANLQERTMMRLENLLRKVCKKYKPLRLPRNECSMDLWAPLAE